MEYAKGWLAMKHWLKTITATAITTVMIFSLFAMLASAETQTLPEGFLIIDQDGITVDPTNGTYEVLLTDMEPGEVYEHTLRLHNMVTDGTFDLFMRAEPVSSEPILSGTTGEELPFIDLFEASEITLSLDGAEFYKGSPNGIGSIDMSTQSSPLGTFATNDIKDLKMIATLPADRISRELADSGYGGQIEFRWIFTAVQTKTGTPPHTGINMRTVLYIVIALLAMIVLTMYLLVMKKRKEQAQAIACLPVSVPAERGPS